MKRLAFLSSSFFLARLYQTHHSFTKPTIPLPNPPLLYQTPTIPLPNPPFLFQTHHSCTKPTIPLPNPPFLYQTHHSFTKPPLFLYQTHHSESLYQTYHSSVPLPNSPFFFKSTIIAPLYQTHHSSKPITKPTVHAPLLPHPQPSRSPPTASLSLQTGTNPAESPLHYGRHGTLGTL